MKRHAACLFTIGMLAGPAFGAEINLRAIGIVSTHQHHTALEREFYSTLADETGLDIAVNFNPLDVVGVNMQDTFRLVRSGTFDIVEITIGSAARDDPFVEGLDLIGVSPDIEALEKTVEAYRAAFEERVAERFNARVMALWPYGPQMFYCSSDVESLEDLAGKKVRSFTPTMSALLEWLGASPVTLQFAEVYPALQRGVADCALTSATSGNTGNWPEVTKNLMPLGVSWSMQGHFMNLDSWNRLSPEAQEKLSAAFEDLETQYWDMARELSQMAVNCNVGKQPCEGYVEYDMTLVEPSESDREKLHQAVTAVVLPTWGEACDSSMSGCSEIWNATVGAAHGLSID